MNTLEIMHGPYVVRHDVPFIAARTLMHWNGFFDTPAQDVLDQYAQQILSLDAEHKEGHINARDAYEHGRLLEGTMVDVIMKSHMNEDAISRVA